MGRAPCCAKVGLHRGPWTPKEDSLLINYINTHGEGQWRSLPKKAGLLRCGKSCRLRWMNYLRPDIKRGNITPDEDDLIIRLHALLGNRWSLIAGRLPGRTDNEIKNYWNTHLSKKLRSQGIDPETHKNLPVISSLHTDVDVDQVHLHKQPKSRKTKVNSNSKKNNKTILKNNKKKKRHDNTKQSALPKTSNSSSSTTTTKEETTTIIKTKVHLPKAVRLTAPLSMSSALTRNSSNASFDSNLTSCLTTSTTCTANTSTGGGGGGGGVLPADYLISWPPTSDHTYSTINLHDHLPAMLPAGCDTGYVSDSNGAPPSGEVRFLIGCEDDGNHGKFEKLYDEYLQLIKVSDHHHHDHDDDDDDRINNNDSSGDFSYGGDQGHQDHEFDLFADSLLI